MPEELVSKELEPEYFFADMLIAGFNARTQTP